jgi:hypothetical protein
LMPNLHLALIKSALSAIVLIVMNASLKVSHPHAT